MSEGFTRAGGVKIPGPAVPEGMRRAEASRPSFPVGELSFVRLVRDATIGDRRCAAGDVVKVSTTPRERLTIMPPVSLLFQDRAKWLVEKGVAEPHHGPATVHLGDSMDLDKTVGAAIEAATNPTPREAARAVAPRQGRGAL